MFEDDFLEFDYESRNGSDDFYSYNSRDFDESWQAEEFTEDDVRNLTDAYWDDLLESDI